VKAIGTNHGVFDGPTIDASCCWIHAVCFLSQINEAFIN
jgi:hypothetical protein